MFSSKVILQCEFARGERERIRARAEGLNSLYDKHKSSIKSLEEDRWQLKVEKSRNDDNIEALEKIIQEIDDYNNE